MTSVLRSRMACCFLVFLSFGPAAVGADPAARKIPNILDEINPFDPDIEEQLEEYDREHQRETGMPAFLDDVFTPFEEDCFRDSCELWAQIVKSTQRMYLYHEGRLQHVFKTSTGQRGYRTPNFDTHPNGRVYDRYTSRLYPDGDYRGLGNMPYAVFIRGGFAIHGTTEDNIPKLGKPASHGCIRLHPEAAYYFNRMVRHLGVRKVWITVQD